jgi:hypothetical protein
MIHIPSFIKIGSEIQKLIRELHRQQGDLISLLLFLENNESWLKILVRISEEWRPFKEIIIKECILRVRCTKGKVVGGCELDSPVFNLRFSQRSVRKVTTYGTRQHVVPYNFTDVSEESTASLWSKSKLRSQQVSFFADLFLQVCCVDYPSTLKMEMICSSET